jgi:hypothetical protein
MPGGVRGGGREAPLYSISCLYIVFLNIWCKCLISADMFEIVNKAILVHPLFQGYIAFYSRLLKEAGPV